MSDHWKHLLAIAESEVESILRTLPPDLATEARRVPVTFESCPSTALQEDGIEPDTLGLFVGNSFVEFETGSSPLPPQVFLYLENLWDVAGGSESAFRAELRTTFLHELGHYLGLDEADLEERGLE